MENLYFFVMENFRLEERSRKEINFINVLCDYTVSSY